MYICLYIMISLYIYTDEKYYLYIDIYIYVWMMQEYNTSVCIFAQEEFICVDLHHKHRES